MISPDFFHLLWQSYCWHSFWDPWTKWRHLCKNLLGLVKRRSGHPHGGGSSVDSSGGDVRRTGCLWSLQLTASRFCLRGERNNEFNNEYFIQFRVFQKIKHFAKIGEQLCTSPYFWSTQKNSWEIPTHVITNERNNAKKWWFTIQKRIWQVQHQVEKGDFWRHL